MNKKIAIILIVTLFILITALLAFGNVDKVDVKKDNGEAIESLNAEEQNEEISSDVNKEETNEIQTDSVGVLEFDVNQQYTDNDFLFTLKKYELKDGVYKYQFEVLNINDGDTNLDYSLFKCVINQQSVDVNEKGIVTVEGKKKKSIEITCNSDSEDVYLTYLSTMYDGSEDLVIFGKK